MTQMKQVYIVAVSGGVDSVVLLHKIVASSKSQSSISNPQSPIYIVAHFDHGIRPDSANDAKFVERLAKSYGLAFVSKRVEMGVGASEESARNARYEFLISVMKKHSAEAVITAHHQDDVLETMIVNMLRGTGPRGLIGFSRPSLLRPLLDKPKIELLNYAKTNNLEWREDSTNLDMTYIRNYVRHEIVPKLSSSQRQKLIEIRNREVGLCAEIDDQAKKLLVQTLEKGELVRSRFVVLPYLLQKELIAVWLRLNGVELDRKMIERAVLSAKTLSPNKTVELTSKVTLRTTKNTIVLNVDLAHV